MKLIKFFLPIIIVLIVSFFSVRPLFISGFFPMHDDTQVARVYEMGKALKDGMFPVRWAQDLGYGYGYPIFTFYAPLAYYIGGFLAFFSSALLATKSMMVLGILLAGITMYLFCQSVWGKLGGAIGAIFYVYATYHAVEIYVRGDVAEFFGYAFIPLAAYGLLQIYKKAQDTGHRAQAQSILPWFAIAAFGYAAIIISHNLTAFMVTPFLFIFAGIFSVRLLREKYSLMRILFPFAGLILGLLLAAFYWLPVFTEMHYTNVLSQVGGGANYKDHFVCLSQLWYSPWGYGGSVPGCIDGLSFMIGKLHLLAVLIAVFLVLLQWRKQNQYRYWLIGGLVGFAISVFLTTSLSQLVWNAVSFMKFFQYPWRFLILVSFFSSFLGGGSILFFSKQFLRILYAGLIICSVVFLQEKFFSPQKILAVSSSYYTNLSMIRWQTSKISDEYMPKDFLRPTSVAQVASMPFVVPQGSIRILQNKTQQKTAEITVSQPASVTLQIAYFPGWRVWVDGSNARYIIDRKGLSIPISLGTHTISAEYRETFSEMLGDGITIASTFMLILGIIYERRKKQHYGKARS